MAMRKRMRMARDRRVFKVTARKTKKINQNLTYRGGTRL